MNHPCDDGCQYSKDVGMWPEHSCGNGCMYDKYAVEFAREYREWLRTTVGYYGVPEVIYQKYTSFVPLTPKFLWGEELDKAQIDLNFRNDLERYCQEQLSQHLDAATSYIEILGVRVRRPWLVDGNTAMWQVEHWHDHLQNQCFIRPEWLRATPLVPRHGIKLWLTGQQLRGLR